MKSDELLTEANEFVEEHSAEVEAFIDEVVAKADLWLLTDDERKDVADTIRLAVDQAAYGFFECMNEKADDPGRVIVGFSDKNDDGTEPPWGVSIIRDLKGEISISLGRNISKKVLKTRAGA